MSSSNPPLYKCVYPYCPARFYNKSAKGNCKRHLREQHIAPTIQVCTRCDHASPNKREAKTHSKQCGNAAFEQSMNEHDRLISPISGNEYSTEDTYLNHLVKHCEIGSTSLLGPPDLTIATHMVQPDWGLSTIEDVSSVQLPSSETLTNLETTSVVPHGSLPWNTDSESHGSFHPSPMSNHSGFDGWSTETHPCISSSVHTVDAESTTNNAAIMPQYRGLPMRPDLEPLQLAPQPSYRYLMHDEPRPSSVHPPQVLPSGFFESGLGYLNLQ